MCCIAYQAPSGECNQTYTGYATGQFGKNHLGDRNEHLPTVHGFDEFFGNLYHLNAEEEPEYPNYPKDPAFRKKYGPRGVMKCKATDKDDPTIDEQFGKVGKQVIENTGSLTRKRMGTVDEEFIGAALDFIERKTKAGGPWFCYFNPTRMHVFTHLKPSSDGKTGLGLYPDGMVELDGYVGQLLKKLEDLGVVEIGDKTYKVHLDGFNLLPFLSGNEKECPRQSFLYWSDDGDMMAMRMGRFKIVFAEQRRRIDDAEGVDELSSTSGYWSRTLR